MIYYRPTEGDAFTAKIDYRPRTCFLMTQLGKTVPSVIQDIRGSLGDVFLKHKIDVIDANSVVTGKDFLIKIWRMLLGVPLGIAIIHKEMSQQTFANIFYEIGLLQAYGKENLVIKTKGTPVPSDFVRTEYIEFNDGFKERMGKFVDSFFEQAEYYSSMADQLDNNPLLAIDYLKRAYLISGDGQLKKNAKQIFEDAGIVGRSKNSVELLLVDFCR
ncbi:MAG: hypothetical protein JSW39_10290 [Desulfobacterales bacterium]|nr:MAG: hypothetical protein JSW39_10290 [Desulfobacterales bacterium]